MTPNDSLFEEASHHLAQVGSDPQQPPERSAKARLALLHTLRGKRFDPGDLDPDASVEDSQLYAALIIMGCGQSPTTQDIRRLAGAVLAATDEAA